MQKFKINYYPFIVNFRWGKKQSQKIDSCWEKQIEFQSTKDPSFHYQKFFLFVAFGTQLRKNIQLWKQNTYKLYQIELTDRKDFREKSTKAISRGNFNTFVYHPLKRANMKITKSEHVMR